MNLTPHLLENLIDITWQASFAIMAIYQKTIHFSLKEDKSPLTQADLISHDILTKNIAKLFPGIPIISEENQLINKITSPLFWLIDPLDGTKEFIHKNGEFTINIALIENNKPTFGLICCPALNHLYIGSIDLGIIKYTHESSTIKKTLLNPVFYNKENLCIVYSRSHEKDIHSNPYISSLPIKTFIPLGSALKFCYLIEGIAHLYPRFTGSMEWDTAAGHALLIASGGKIECIDKKPLEYGKIDFKNPAFIAKANFLD